MPNAPTRPTPWMTRLGVFLLVPVVTILLMPVTTSGATTRTASRSAAQCGAVIPRAGASGPIVGPIQFHGIRRAGLPAQKVLLILRRAIEGTVVITGASCTGDTRMRFLYDASPPAVFNSTTGITALVLRGRNGDAWPGYMVWSKPGDWKLTVRRGGSVLGSLVFCVAQAALGYSSAPCA
jgi:hypothetical protein